MLPKNIKTKLEGLGCIASATSDLVSGVKLASLINRVFYHNSNNTFENKIIKENEQRKGNNVININIILKQIKNDENIQCSEEIRKITSFAMIEDEKEMINFVQWILEEAAKVKTDSEDVNKTLKGSQPTEKREVSQFLMRHNDRSTIEELAKQFEVQNEGALHQMNEDNAFENVFFCDRDIEPDNVKIENDSLDGSEEKIAKKGSFKILKPKTIFDYKLERNLNEENEKQMKKFEHSKEEVRKKENKKFPPSHSELPSMQLAKDGYVEPQFTISEEYQVKNTKDIDEMNEKFILNEGTQKQELEARMTVPKILQRPPIDKKSKQQTIKVEQKNRNPGSFFKTPTPFNANSGAASSNGSSRSSLEKERELVQNKGNRSSQSQNIRKFNEQLFRDVEQIDREIKNEKEEIKRANSSAKRSVTQSNRKVFKICIEEIPENEKKCIVEWLISINLLNSMAADYYDKLHEICKNGVIFPEIINHQKGRGAELGYFKKPKRSAEVHSNYQKVFTYLKDIPTFNSELLFHYEYFVPEAQETSFWSFLHSCKNAFQKKTTENSRVYTRQTMIKSRLNSKPTETMSSFRKISTQRKNSTKKSNENTEYQKIRYGSSQKENKMIKSNQKEENKHVIVHRNSKNGSEQKRKSSLEFIKELPDKPYRHDDLIQQVQAEVEQKLDGGEGKNKKNGYRNLHELKKNQMHNNSLSNINTPKKKNSDLSVSRSRIVSTNSMKKKQSVLPQPSVSLEMEMKALKYLKQKNLFNPMVPGLDVVSLFDDPIRNGTLFNQIIKEEFQQSHRYVQRPKNIEDCRDNFRIAFAQLRCAFAMIPLNYEHHFEEIIRGELNLFYGIIWHVITGGNNNKLVVGLNPLKNQSAILNLSQHGNLHQGNVNIEEEVEKLIFWVRALEQESSQIAALQIRDFNSLHYSIVSKNLLFKIACVLTPEKYTLKPTYENPINTIEQQSNLKKILSFFTHNKIIKLENSWKTRSLVNKDFNGILNVMKELMNYHSKIREKYNGNSYNGISRGGQTNSVSFIKYARKNSFENQKNPERGQKLETTMANHSFGQDNQLFPPKSTKVKEKCAPVISIEVPWMRKLGYSGDLSLNNGVILCRLVSQMTMQTIVFSENPSSKAEGLINIRKSIRLIEKFKWDEYDISNADEKTSMEIYKFLKEKYKNSYAMKMAL